MHTRYTERQTLLSSPAFPVIAKNNSFRGEAPLTIRQAVWTVLHFRASVQHDSGLHCISYFFELGILVLILLNVLLAVSQSSGTVAANADSEDGLGSVEKVAWYHMFLLVSTIIFSVEYALRLWACVEDQRYPGTFSGRLKWMTRPMSLLDLFALIPFILEVFFDISQQTHSLQGALTLRSLRLLRIISFLRLERFYNALRDLRVVFSRKKEEFLIVTYLTALVILISSTTIFFLEKDEQPNVFSSISRCAWWSVETITSIGYGDMVPETVLGQTFGAIVAILGIILFTIPGAILGSSFIEVMLEKQKRQEDELRLEIMRMQNDSMIAPQPDMESKLTLSRVESTSIAAKDELDTLHAKIDNFVLVQEQMQAQLQLQQRQLQEITLLLREVMQSKIR